MKSITELERDIVSITFKIYNEFPELSKYIGEIPIHYASKESNHLGAKKFKEYYNSLAGVVSEYAKTQGATSENIDTESVKFKGYPQYPPSEDIYNQGIQETELNPEDPSKNKASNEKAFREVMPGDNLDVPGSELDDQQESIGSEDEENNYYSLGGDNHDN